jgi:hypothetical protein
MNLGMNRQAERGGRIEKTISCQQLAKRTKGMKKGMNLTNGGAGNRGKP